MDDDFFGTQAGHQASVELAQARKDFSRRQEELAKAAALAAVDAAQHAAYKAAFRQAFEAAYAEAMKTGGPG